MAVVNEHVEEEEEVVEERVKERLETRERRPLKIRLPLEEEEVM